MKQFAAKYNNRKKCCFHIDKEVPDGMSEEYQSCKHGGRKKGSLNKNTLEKIAQQQKFDKVQKQDINSLATYEQPKRRPGRP